MAEDWRNYSLDELREQVLGKNTKFFQSEFNPQTGLKSITRYWRVSHGPVEQVRDFLYEYCDGDQLTATTEVTDPAVADGVRQSGTWKLTKIFELQERPGNIYETLVQKIDGNELEVMSRNGCAFIITRWYHWDEAEVEDIPQGSSGIVWSVENVSRDSETGLYDYVVEKRETLTLKMGAWVSEIDSSQHTDTTVWKGVREGDIDQDGNDITGLDNMEREVGKIKRENRTKNDDCTHDIKQDITEVVDQTGSAHSDRRDRSDDEITHTQLGYEITAPVAGDGEYVEVSSRPTDAGLYATTERRMTIFDLQGAGKEDRADQDTETEKHSAVTDSDARLEMTTAPGDGQVVDVELSETEYKNRSGFTKRIITAKNQVNGVIEDRHDQKTTIVENTQNTGEADEPEIEVGNIMTVRNTKTIFKDRTKTEEITTIGKPQEKIITWTDGDGDNYIYIWWHNQQPGYGQSIADQYCQDYNVGVNCSENQFGLEDGHLSGNDKDNNGRGGYWYNVGWVTRDMAEWRYTTVVEKVNGQPVPKLYKCLFTWQEFSRTVASFADAQDTRPPGNVKLCRYTYGEAPHIKGHPKYEIKCATAPEAQGSWAPA